MLKCSGLKSLVTIGLLLIMCAPAFAATGQLVSGNSDIVFVWKSKEAMNEASDLRASGALKSVDPKVFLALISCVVPDGTPAETTSWGILTQDVIVTEGEMAGCRGNVGTEEFKPDLIK